MSPIFETVLPEFDCACCTPGGCDRELIRRFDALRPLQTFVFVTAEDPTPVLSRLQEQRPGLFEWASLQVGPPWRIEIARLSPNTAEVHGITESIEWDHDRLGRLERTAFDAWGAGDLPAAKSAFAMFAHGLRGHIGLEEALLFPEFERRSGIASDGPTAALRSEHREILALVGAIELAIRSDAVPAPALRSHLRDVLRAHNGKEEQMLYPVADRVLTSDERKELVSRMTQYHRE
jgi:uncharacterized protein (DUF2249 family)